MYEEIQPFLDKTSANLENGTRFIKSKSTLCMSLLTLEPDHPPEQNWSIQQEQEHFNQTRVSPLLLQVACNPVLMRFLVIQ